MTGKDNKRGQNKHQASDIVNSNGGKSTAQINQGQNIVPQVQNTLPHTGAVQGQTQGACLNQGNVQSLQNFQACSNYQNQNPHGQSYSVHYNNNSHHQQQSMNNAHNMPMYDQGVNATTFLGQLQGGSPIPANNNGMPLNFNGTASTTEMQTRMFEMIHQMNSSFLSRLDSIDKKMSRLDPIEREISLARSDITALKIDNSALNCKVNDLEKSCETISSFFDHFKSQSSKADTDLKHIQHENSVLKEEINSLNSKYAKVQDELLDLKTRSMQENLLFFGLCEAPRGQQENTESKLRDFLKTELEVTEQKIDEIVFDRVHRLGRVREDIQSNPRPIVAKFEKYTDREHIRKAAIGLNEKRIGFSIREQFPKEVEETRKSLYPIMRQLKQDPNNRVSLVRDKLYINGALYTGPVAKTNIRQTDRPANINPQRYPRERVRQNRSQLFANRSHSAPRETDILWNNQFRALQNEDSFSNDRPYGKRKANSPLSSETENKKCNESASPTGNLSCGENSYTPHQAVQNVMDTSEPIHNSPDRQNTSDQLTCSGDMSQSVLNTTPRAESVESADDNNSAQ